MKKIAVFLVVALTMLVFTSVASAHVKPKFWHRHLKGEITSIDTSASTVTFERLRGDSITLTVTTETVIHKNGHRATFGDLALADRGHAKFKKTEVGQLVALKIFGHTPKMVGRVTEITSDTVTLKRPRFSRTFIINGDTVIRRNGRAAALADLKVGDIALVRYNGTESGEFLALKIRAAGKKR